MGINVCTPYHCTLRLIISLCIEYLELLDWCFIRYPQPVPLKISVDLMVYVVLYVVFLVFSLVQESVLFLQMTIS